MLRGYRRRGAHFFAGMTEEQKDALIANNDYVAWYALLAAGGPPMNNPATVAVVEQIRAERLTRRLYQGRKAFKRRKPVDAFVLALGEPARREVTKIGGLPYWQAAQPWPLTAAGKPMTFVAQFCFADSRDIVGDLPGDVLLIFGELGYVSAEDIRKVMGPNWNTQGEWEPNEMFSTFRFEWRTLDDQPLVGPEAMPETDWPLTPCYGQIHRTYDYLFGNEYWQGQFPGVLQTTKIGGVPRDCQYDPRQSATGRFIGTLEETRVNYEVPYPFANLPRPLKHQPKGWYRLLKWGDGGLMHLMLDGDEINEVVECH